MYSNNIFDDEQSDNFVMEDITDVSLPKYINPYTDFGLKKLFGTPMNKDLLISFLNALFEGEEVIDDLTYLNGEFGT